MSAASGAPTFSGHIIVCGLGRVGYRLTLLLLRLGEKVVVINQAAREDWLRAARAAGAEIITGDARSAATLALAGLAHARAVIAATNHDVVNIETALDARQQRPDLPIVVRLFDRDLGGMLEERLGVRRALGSSALAGPTLAYAAVGEEVLATLTLGGRPFVVGRVRVEARSTLAGLTAAATERQHQVVVLDEARDPATPLAAGDVVTLLGEQARFNALSGVTTPAAVASAAAATPPRATWSALRRSWSNAPAALRVMFLFLLVLICLSVLVFSFGMRLSLVDAIYYVVTTVTTTGYGDITPKENGAFLKLYASLVMLIGSVTMAILYAFATDFVVSERFRKVFGQPTVPKSGHKVVVGVGNVGYRVVDELLAAGRAVVAVDLKIEGELAAALRQRCSVVAGDGRVPATLEAANVAGAAAVVAATGDDAANLAVGLHARRLAPHARVVVRLFDPDLARKVEAGGLVDVALSPSRVAAPAFVAAALHEGVQAAFADETSLCVLATRRVPADCDGLSAAEVGRRLGARLVLVARDATSSGAVQDWTAPCAGPPGDAPLRAGQQVLCALRQALPVG
ncbi:MAG: NAD-binding protein [Deltaproteobacteria bacterium]|nr:NAD-binding protein [Deltaproteobacteria bacterium]